MGDIADFMIEQMIDGPFHLGGGLGRAHRRPATRVRCRYCGETDLRWGNVKGGHWRIKNKDGSLHVCPSNIERLYGGI